MIILNFTRDYSGVINIERELTEIEKSTLISQKIKENTIEYYFIGDKIDTSVSIYEIKERLISLVDQFTQSEITKGFVYNGRTFSMSTNAQINWSNLLSIPNSMFPIQIMDVNDEPFSLGLFEKEQFYYAYLNHKYSKLQQGNALKIQLKSLETEQELIDFEKNNLL